jgi:hypothetical protein
MRLEQAGGFSLFELVVATGLAVVLSGAAFTLLGPSHDTFAVQSEVADMQQRARAAVDALHRDLIDAGRGRSHGSARPLIFALAPILPLRLGARGGDPPGSVRSDVITMLSVPERAAQTSIEQPLPATAATVAVRLEPGCPLGDPASGFAPDMDVLVHDGTGAFDTFRVSAVAGPALTLEHTLADWPKVYPAGSTLVEIRTRTYYVRPAQSARPPQLVRYGGGRHPDVPVVDHVVGLSFDYFGEPEPPLMHRPLTDPRPPWTTYGPPPPVDPAATPVAPASSCLFAASGAPLALPRLASLGPAAGPLVRLAPGQLSDGPFCPDGSAPNRFDADLLRVRSIEIGLRVQAANAALRGPAGPLFAQGGTARSGGRYVPDLEWRFRVSPRGLAPGR